MADRRLVLGGLAFGVLALAAGALQLWALIDTDRPRHVVVAVFALSIGVSVVVAAVRTLCRKTPSLDEHR